MARNTTWGSKLERSRLPLSWWEKLMGDGHGYVDLAVALGNQQTTVCVLAKVVWSPSKSAEWRGDFKKILAINHETVAQAVFDQRREFLSKILSEVQSRKSECVHIYEIKDRKSDWYIPLDEFLAMAQRQRVLIHWVTKNNPDQTLGEELKFDTARSVFCPLAPSDLESFGITVPVGLLEGGLSVMAEDKHGPQRLNELELRVPHLHPKYLYEQQTIVVRLKPTTKSVDFKFWPRNGHIYYRVEFPK